MVCCTFYMPASWPGAGGLLGAVVYSRSAVLVQTISSIMRDTCWGNVPNPLERETENQGDKAVCALKITENLAKKTMIIHDG